MISAIIYKSSLFAKWVVWLRGIASAVLYFLAQTKLFATAIPNLPVIGWAGLFYIEASYGFYG